LTVWFEVLLLYLQASLERSPLLLWWLNFHNNCVCSFLHLYASLFSSLLFSKWRSVFFFNKENNDWRILSFFVRLLSSFLWLWVAVWVLEFMTFWFGNAIFLKCRHSLY
jgi:hypothetical protein